MEPVVVAGILLAPSLIVFLGGCAIAGYRTLRELSLPRTRPALRQPRF